MGRRSRSRSRSKRRRSRSRDSKSRPRRSRSPRPRSRKRSRSRGHAIDRKRDYRSRRSRSRRRSRSNRYRSKRRSRSRHADRRRSRGRRSRSRDKRSKSRDRKRRSRERSEDGSSRSRSAGKSKPEKENGEYPADGPKSDSDNHLLYRNGDVLEGRFVILKTIGEGTFGKVVLCYDRQREQEKVALKVIKRVKKYYKSAKLEINVLKKIEECDPQGIHRCVKLLDHFDYHGFMCLSFEWLGQSIFDFLKDNLYFPYPLDHVRAISYQMIDAVAFLHRNNITHTDLKPENILFVDSAYSIKHNDDRNRDERHVKDCRVKLIDFGSATFDEEDHTTIVSTRHYRAIEVILEMGWDQKCDVWSVGSIMFELYSGTTLFQTHNNLEHLAMMTYIFGKIPADMIKETRKTKYFRHGKLDWDFEERSSSNSRIKCQCKPFVDCVIKKGDAEHDALFDVMRQLLEYVPEKRLSMKDALNHDFFDSVRDQYATPEQDLNNSGSHCPLPSTAESESNGNHHDLNNSHMNLSS